MVTTRKRVGIDEIKAILQKHGVKQTPELVKEFQSLPVRQKADPPPKGGIGIREAAKKYRLHDRTISRWAQRGEIPVIKRTKYRLYINEKALIGFLKQRGKSTSFC